MGRLGPELLVVGRYLFLVVASIAIPAAVQWWDRRRLSAGRRARGWNTASWWAALYQFGVLSMLGYIFVTRRPWLRCPLAGLWTAGVLVPLAATQAAFEALFPTTEAEDTTLAQFGLELVGVALVATALTLVVEMIVHAKRGLLGQPSPMTEWRRAVGDT
ncbi:MAG: hypothetical protein AAGA56_01235 [Myxococcota bacterium]